MLMGTISSPSREVPYSGKKLLTKTDGYGSMNESIEGSFEGVTKDISMGTFTQN